MISADCDNCLLSQRHESGSHGKQASSSSGGLRVRWSPSKNFYVENLYIFECKSAKEAR